MSPVEYAFHNKVDSSLNVMAHGNAHGKGIEGETGDWRG